MIIRQVRIKDTMTQRETVKEMTKEQHTDILRKVALTYSPLEVELIKEREL